MKQGQQLRTGPGKGVRRGCHVQHVCRFDDETFEALRAHALRENVSLSEAIRQMVEIGLEEMGNG